MPEVEIVNMASQLKDRKGSHILSVKLENEIRQCIAAGKQAILLLNRRGHSSYVYCTSCQFVLTCPNCDVSLTYHKKAASYASVAGQNMICHYCMHSSKLPATCPLCAKKLSLLGPGTQKAEEEIQRKFPDLRLMRVDSDSMKPGMYEKVLKDFEHGKIDVLMGTQMLAKGLDFPNVALVGVLNADGALSIPDFRSGERTFQLIAQVAGRTGRAYDDGKVIVQSFVPEEPAIAMACEHDFDSFAQYELAIRRHCKLPPYHRYARIIMRDTKLEKLQEQAANLRLAINSVIEEKRLRTEVRGPMPAGIARVENYYRYEILIKAPNAAIIQKLLYGLRGQHLAAINVQTVVDVDPINLL